MHKSIWRLLDVCLQAIYMLQVQGGEPRCSPAKPWSENTGEPGRCRRWYVWGRASKRESYSDRKNDYKYLMSPLSLCHLITRRQNSTSLDRNNFWGKNDYWRPMYWVGLDAMILVFWMLSFKPTFSLSSFTFIKRLFSSSSLSAIRVVSSAYPRLLIFLLAILIPACASSSPVYVCIYAYKHTAVKHRQQMQWEGLAEICHTLPRPLLQVRSS